MISGNSLVGTDSCQFEHTSFNIIQPKINKAMLLNHTLVLTMYMYNYNVMTHSPNINDLSEVISFSVCV